MSLKIQLLAVGNRQPRWVVEACEDYLKRIPRDLAVTLVEIKPEPRTNGKTPEQMRAAEMVRLDHVISGEWLVALDEHGEDLTSQALSRRLDRWLSLGRTLSFVIGGPDGLHDDFLLRANEKIRLSSMTLPHGMARVLLCEQLYRASTLLKGHPYHRD